MINQKRRRNIAVFSLLSVLIFIILYFLESIIGILWLLICALCAVLYLTRHPEIKDSVSSGIQQRLHNARSRVFSSNTGKETIDFSFLPEYSLIRVDTLNKQIFPITEEICLIGRAKNCHIRLANEDTVSKEHCRIVFRKYSREYYVEDMHSKNGTYLGTRRLEPYTQEKLLDDSELSIGGCRFKFAKKPGT